MRVTIRLDDELLERLKAQARRENVSLTRLLNCTYREQPHATGAPRVALDKSLALAAAVEDSEIVRELALRK
jgi:predicted DNA-binding ribbon-helix-helix protein